MIAAATHCAVERGSANVTVAHVVNRAGVSRRTFYELFDGCEDCLLAAIDEGFQRVADAVVPAWDGPGSWRERIRAALIELLSFLDYDPVSGRLVVVETLGAGHRALERRGNVLAQAIAAVDEGRAEAKQGNAPPPLTAEGVVGAVASVLHGRMLTGHSEPLIELTSPLMSMIVLPYLGPAAARKEAQRPAPVPARFDDGRPVAEESPLCELPMRLTYRTLRVLAAIASEPGASNRVIGKTSGVEDQGQISKLLKRLEKLGLITNAVADGPLRGMANAWRLTAEGEQITRSLRV